MAKERDQVTEFWHNLEDELSEPILIYSLGKCHNVPGRERGALWGLFFLTPSAFFFMHFPQSNWFSLLLNQAERARRHRRKLTIRVSRNTILSIRAERPPGFWKRLLAIESQAIFIDYLDSEGRHQSLKFALEKDRDNFLNLLDTRNLFRR